MSAREQFQVDKDKSGTLERSELLVTYHPTCYPELSQTH